MENKALFSLTAETKAAERIVRANPQFRDPHDNNALIFESNHRSKFPGHLVTFGRLLGFHDVYLPEDGFAQYQCAFYLLRNGELMLEDFTTGHHTYLHWHDDRRNEDEAYRLQGDPRRRVIPQAPNGQITLRFGTEVTFAFIWQQATSPISVVEKSKAALAKIAQENVMPNPPALLSVPRDPKLPATAYEDASARTPQVPKELDGRPLRQLHMYKEVGSGRCGTVYKAADLATGQLWAVKECRPSSRWGEGWKTPLLKEVEKLAQLQHPNIIRLEHHQGWSEGLNVQIFFPLCDGSVRDLLPPGHRCKENTSTQEPWLAVFIDQVLSGLEHIHQNDMVHRDLKPENILFNNRAGPNGGSHSFYISDFGLVTHIDSLKRSSRHLAGTLPYMAPETTLRGEYSTASDIYSFGLMLLEILGIYCPEEGSMALEEWRKKLQAYGVRRYRQYCDKITPKAIEQSTQIAHSRIQSLADYGLARWPVPCLLNQDPARRATASDARLDLLSTYGPRNGDTASRVDGEHYRAELPAEPHRIRRVAGFERTECAVELPAEPVVRRRSTIRGFELPTRLRKVLA